MARDAEDAEGTESVPSASALATESKPTPSPVKTSEDAPKDATFQGFVVRPASPKYVIRIIGKDGTGQTDYRSSIDASITPVSAHTAVLRASTGDSVRGTVNALGIIRSFEIISKAETVTGIVPGIKPGSGDKVEPKKQAADPVARAGYKQRREQKKQAKRAAANATPSAPQDAPAKTRCPFCRGNVHESMEKELLCMNATRFARRANRRGQRQNDDD